MAATAGRTTAADRGSGVRIRHRQLAGDGRSYPAVAAVPTLRSLAPSVFLPALVYEIGNGAVAPVIALTALDLGASASLAGFMLALLGIGQVLADVPASSLADRIGDRRAMIVAAGVAIVAMLGCLLARSLVILGLALIVVGMSNATFYLARQSYLTEVAPAHLRARAMSTLAGSHRIGLFIGPVVGAGAIAVTSMRGAYAVAMISASAAALLLFFVPDVEVPARHDRVVVNPGSTSMRTMLQTHRRLFATLGFAVLTVGAVRAARNTVLPLWAEHLGLTPEKTSLIFGIAAAVDMALFYPAGKVMDQFGRLAIALPAMLILGLSVMALPLTVGAMSLTIVAITMSFGNGIGSGIMMTLGADAAPVDGRVRFLGIWRLLSDSGQAAGPVLLSVVAAASTLTAGIVAIGSCGLIAAAALTTWVPRYCAFATRKAVLAHRVAAELAPEQASG